MSLSAALSDVQGIVVRGYGGLRGARFVLLGIRDAEAARSWLRDIEVRDAASRPAAGDHAAQIALTAPGLAALGLDDASLATFAREFREGMAGTRHRSRILGDAGGSDPAHWRWGGPNTAPVHVLLMLYAADEEAVAALAGAMTQRAVASGLEVVDQLTTQLLPDNREHFGFRDGIARPKLAGLGEASGAIPAGEFVLGYANAYGQLPPGPTVAPDPDLPDRDGRGDLGCNGSYLVFRQLSQDVRAFWQRLDAAARGDLRECIALAAKMVGRWPGGAPLVKSPDRDDPAMAEDDDFLYYRSDDPHGLRCPIGAHIRRTNPRDALDPAPGSDRSIEVGLRHLLLRRGRTYGAPLADTLDPADLLAAAEDGVERGLHFLCFNAHLGRQFEFVQHTWINNPKFDGLYADDDPLIGARGAGTQAEAGTFTVQAEPVRRRVSDLPRFVETRGGAYFFLPGIHALRYLARSW